MKVNDLLGPYRWVNEDVKSLRNGKGQHRISGIHCLSNQIPEEAWNESKNIGLPTKRQQQAAYTLSTGALNAHLTTVYKMVVYL